MNRSEVMPVMHNTLDVYGILCKSFCKSQDLPQTAFDILMFLANHPQYNTAKAITSYRGIPANLVSTYVELLVSRGLLTREAVPEDRRRIRLTCTSQAATIIESGREIQQKLFDLLYEGIDAGELEVFHHVMQQLAHNALNAKTALRKGE